MVDEEWRDVGGYEGWYQVSNLGRVRSLDRWILLGKTRRFYPGVTLKGTSQWDGYVLVAIKRKGYRIHRLVAREFLGEIPKGKQVNHKDGNKKNNRLDNLEYVTPSQNIQHSYRTGLCKSVGERHYRSKLTESDVIEIRKKWEEGESQETLSSTFKVTRSCITYVVRRKTWKHVP